MSNSKFTLTTELRAELSDFERGMKKANSRVNKFSRNLNKNFGGVSNQLVNIGAAIGITFGARELFTYAKDAVELSASISGVQEAFDKLKGADIGKLREYTKGTASDFQLMKAAVKAAEFGIDSSKMPQLMQFAAVQANKMGESVDYMVESIVTGLARNSIPILDNLGLSSTMLKEKMKETGDISSAALAVINEKLKETGGLSDNAGVKAAQMQADFNNLKAEIGKELTPAFTELFGAIKSNMPAITNQMKKMATFIAQNFELILKLVGAMGGLVIALQTVKVAQTAFNAVANANPYVLLATALIGVAVALNTIGDAAEKARKQYKAFINENTLTKDSVKGRSDDSLLKEYRQAKKDVLEIEKILKSSSVQLDVQQRGALENKLKMLKSNMNIIREEAVRRREAARESTKLTNKEIENLQTLEAEIKTLQERRQTASLNEIGGINDEIKALQKKIDKYKEATDEIDNTINKLEKMQSKGVDNVGEVKFAKNPNKVGLDKEVNSFNLAPIKPSDSDKEKMKKGAKELAELANQQIGTMLGEGLAGTISGAMESFFNEDANFLEGFGQLIGGLAEQFGKLLIAQGMAIFAFNESLKTLNPFIAIAGGVAMVAAGAAIKTFTSSPPKLANGGIAYGRTLAEVGEYSGAKSNPEVIAPLNKLKTLIQPMNQGNNVNSNVEFEIRGDKLIGVLNNYNKKVNRF
ncbi:hypothetical protein E9993_01610 [Labilibacter sediminis]|nr:hypothetical protein E9993_01610 [Labilibacter sediminis]